MKKILSAIAVILTVTILFCGCKSTGTSDTSSEPLVETDLSQFKYNLNDGKMADIRSFIGTEKDVVIPAQIEGIDVELINVWAFRSTNIESVVIPDTVERIHEEAFSESKKLRTVTLGKNVKYIEKAAFKNCQNLKAIELPSGLTKIGHYAFQSCKSLEKITIPNTVTQIGVSAFSGTSLSEIIFEDGIETIGPYAAFWSSEEIKSITIPASVKEIQESPFNAGLKEVHFLGDAPKMHNNAFDKATKIYYKKGTSGWDKYSEHYTLIEE